LRHCEAKDCASGGLGRSRFVTCEVVVLVADSGEPLGGFVTSFDGAVVPAEPFDSVSAA